MASADNNFTVIEVDTNAILNAHEPAMEMGVGSSGSPRRHSEGDDIVIEADEPARLPLWLSRTYLILSVIVILLCFSVAVLSGLAARRLYLHAYEMGTIIPDPEASDAKTPAHHPPVEPRRRDIFMSFLIYSPCVAVSYALMATVAIPAVSARRVKGYSKLSYRVEAQLVELKWSFLIWLGILTVCMIGATVAFFISPGNQWPSACGVAPLLTAVATLGIMAITWKM